MARSHKLRPSQLNLGQLLSAPAVPGVYRFSDQHGAVIYVGKAKNLRRRLGQYKNAKRIKKHLKMRKILSDAVAVNWQVTDSELSALLLENQLIQQLKPKWNLSGAFYFLYPAIGVRVSQSKLDLVFTSNIEKFNQCQSGFYWTGVFRSRSATKEFFESLNELLAWVGKPAARSQLYSKSGLGRIDRFSLVKSYHRIPESWGDQLIRFLEGESLDLAESLLYALADIPRARRSSKQIQKNLNWLKWFWKHEIAKTKKIRDRLKLPKSFIDQVNRDRFSLQAQAE